MLHATMNIERTLTLISIARTGIPLILLAITFYVYLSKPLQKQREQRSDINHQLQPGCSIVTRNGITGTVCQVLHHTIIIEREDGLKIEVLKESVVEVHL